MFFETQRTRSTQRIKPLKERFQEEAKASSQRATAMVFRHTTLSVQCRRHLLIKLCVLNNTQRTLCSQCYSASSVSSVLKIVPARF